jgi:hypothetical protein
MSRLFRMNEVEDWPIRVIRATGGGSRSMLDRAKADNTSSWSRPTVERRSPSRQGLRTTFCRCGPPPATGSRFISSLTGGVMTIAIDPATGRAVGPVKRVTIDSVTPRGFDVAPDGKRIAYFTPTGPNTLDLRVVSINGGPATTLTTVQGGADVMRFDRSGAHIYFAVNRLEGTPKNDSGLVT